MKNLFLPVAIAVAILFSGCTKGSSDNDGGQSKVPQITIALSTDTLGLSHRAHTPAEETITVICTQEDGEPASDAEWSLVSNEPWLRLSLEPDGSAADTILLGVGTRDVYIVADENTHIARAARITLCDSEEDVVGVGQTSGASTATALMEDLYYPFYFPFKLPQPIHVDCRTIDGEPDPNAEWTLTSSPGVRLSFVNYAGSGLVSSYNTSEQINGTGNRDVYVYLRFFNNGNPSSATLSLSCNGIETNVVAIHVGGMIFSPKSFDFRYLSDDQIPATEKITATCLKWNEEPDDSTPWTISITDQVIDSPSGLLPDYRAKWLQLSRNSVGSIVSTTLNGIGTQDIYAVVTEKKLERFRWVHITPETNIYGEYTQRNTNYVSLCYW